MSFAAGFGVGYFVHAARDNGAIETAQRSLDASSSARSPDRAGLPRTHERDASDGAPREIGARGGPEEEDNPFRAESAEALIARINTAPKNLDERTRDLAMRALMARIDEDPRGVAALLPMITRGGAMHAVCRALAERGGAHGIAAVTDFVLSRTGDMQVRIEAVHALANLSGAAAPAGRAALLGLMRESFPEEMQHAVCHAYGQACGDTAVPSLLELARGGAHAMRPEILIDALGRFGTPDDAPAVLELIKDGAWSSREQTAILRSAARASGRTDTLLGLLAAPPPGVAPELVARAFAEAASSLQIDAEAVLKLLGEDGSSAVKADLARGLVRSRGDEAVRMLLERARSEDAPLDPEALGAALAEARSKDLVPDMLATLARVKNFETLNQLARGVVATSGREGVAALIGLIESGALSEGRLHPVCGALAEAGSAEDAALLFGLTGKIRDPEGARAILKAATQLAGESADARCAALLGQAEDGDVRAAAADILGYRAARTYLPELVDALGKEEFGRAQWHLTRAIAGAGEEGMTRLTEILARDANEARAHEMLNALAYMEGFDSTGFLARALLDNRTPAIRSHAGEILAKKADDAALALLAQAIAREADEGARTTLQAALEAAKKRRQ
jgi:hypothetical protein